MARKMDQQAALDIVVRLEDSKKLDEAREKVDKLAQATEEAEAPMVRTTMASQEFIRIIQDAPYGMLGMTNNIQELSVGLSRMGAQARASGKSMTWAIGQMVKGLLTGPMALPLAIAAITSLMLSMDKLRGAGDRFRVLIGTLTAEQRAWNDALREGAASFVDSFAQDLDVDRLRELQGVVSDLLEETRAEMKETFGYRGSMPDWAVGMDVWMRNFTGIDALTEEQEEQYQNMVRQREVAVALNRQLGEIEGALQIQAELQERGVNAYRTMRDDILQLAIETGALNEEGQVSVDLARERLQVEEQLEHQMRAIRAEERRALRDLANRKDREQLSEAEYQQARVLTNERANQQILEQERALSRHRLQIFQEQVNAQVQSMETAMEGALVGASFGFIDAFDMSTIRMLDIAKRQVTGFSRELNEQLTEMDISQEFAQRILDARIAALEEEHERRMEMGERIGADEMAELDSLNRRKIISEKEHLKERRYLIEEFYRQQRELAINSSVEMVASISSAAQSLYSTWESVRSRELDNLQYTEEQKREILEREGAKRFERMKAIQVAEAIANTIGSGVAAYRAGMEGGWGPLAIVQASAMMASALATGYAQVRKIQSLQIGRGVGGSAASAPSGRFTQLNADITARRVHDFETRQNSESRRNPPNNEFTRAVEKFEQATQQMNVVIDERTAERASNIAERRKRIYNK